MARRRGRARAAAASGPVGLSAARCTASSSLDADDRVLRPGDPLERPAHRRRVRRDRGAGRARAADRADRQPRADRLHRAEAALAAPPRARDATRGSGTSCCRRTTCGCRLTGERAIDVADASGTLLFDVARRRWSDEVCAALEVPLEWLPPALRVDRDRRRGRPGGGRARRRHRPARAASRSCSAPPASSSPRCPRYAPDPEARVHVFCHAVPGHVARDGRDALGGRLARVAPRRARRRATASSTRRRRAGRPAPRACCSRRTSRASARRTPTPTRAARSPGSRSATTAARSRARCSRASPTACATRSSCCARSASQPTVGRVSGGGARSELWLRIVASVLGLPLERTESEAGAAFGAALLAGVREGVFADAAEAVARCVRVRERVEPEPGWAAPTRRATRASGELYPRLTSRP